VYLSGLETDATEVEMLRKTIIHELRTINLLWYPVPNLGFGDGGGCDCDSPRVLSYGARRRLAALDL
jgi:hypothetical protein